MNFSHITCGGEEVQYLTHQTCDQGDRIVSGSTLLSALCKCFLRQETLLHIVSLSLFFSFFFP